MELGMSRAVSIALSVVILAVVLNYVMQTSDILRVNTRTIVDFMHMQVLATEDGYLAEYDGTLVYGETVRSIIRVHDGKQLAFVVVTWNQATGAAGTNANSYGAILNNFIVGGTNISGTVMNTVTIANYLNAITLPLYNADLNTARRTERNREFRPITTPNQPFYIPLTARYRAWIIRDNSSSVVGMIFIPE
jgi:hypothetical protein